MVTDEERDYMYRAYADQAAMRINLGIRRRLAPLVGNDRRKIELLNGSSSRCRERPSSTTATRSGMGDNVYLGDRNGVRTPMQWSTDRNAGFSRANPQRLDPARRHRPRVPLRVGQRREPAAEPDVAPLVDQAPHRAA